MNTTHVDTAMAISINCACRKLVAKAKGNLDHNSECQRNATLLSISSSLNGEFKRLLEKLLDGVRADPNIGYPATFAELTRTHTDNSLEYMCLRYKLSPLKAYVSSGVLRFKDSDKFIALVVV